MPNDQQELQLPSLQDVRVVVVGDVMLDRYWHGEASRVSQEAPVPVVDVGREEFRPGGAANVALNVVSLGARCTLIGVVGDDEAGRTLAGILSAAGVDCDFVVCDDYPTVVKLRIMSQRQQLLRADFENPMPDVRTEIEAKVGQVVGGASVIVLQDYDKGTLADSHPLIGHAKTADVPVLVDPKGKSFSAYAGATVIKPNESEFRQLGGHWDGDEELRERAQAFCRELQIGAFVITRGSRGLEVIDADQSVHIPAREVEVFDVTGAGDTVIAALSVCQALGWPTESGAAVANVAASIVVAKAGTATVSGPELAYTTAQLAGDAGGVVDRDQLLQVVERARAMDERVVFTNGCFDILHAGHVTYLEQARELGDRLVVAVNDDASVRRLKGENRPVNPIDRRLRVLAGLAAVDWVVSFDEDTPEALLHLLKPDVLVKGGDYGPEEVVGHEIVESYGGQVAVLGLVDDCSTTNIIDLISHQ